MRLISADRAPTNLAVSRQVAVTEAMANRLLKMV